MTVDLTKIISGGRFILVGGISENRDGSSFDITIKRWQSTKGDTVGEYSNDLVNVVDENSDNDVLITKGFLLVSPNEPSRAEIMYWTNAVRNDDETITLTISKDGIRPDCSNNPVLDSDSMARFRRKHLDGAVVGLSEGIPLRSIVDGLNNFNHFGDYDISTTYPKYALVSYDTTGSDGLKAVYQAKEAVTGVEPTDTTKWALVLPEAINGESSYVYIASADDASGGGFTYPANNTQSFMAILSTNTAITTPSVGDFTSLWFQRLGEDGQNLTNLGNLLNVDDSLATTDQILTKKSDGTYYFTDKPNNYESVSTSSGAGDFGKIATLNALGKIDESFIPSSEGHSAFNLEMPFDLSGGVTSVSKNNLSTTPYTVPAGKVLIITNWTGSSWLKLGGVNYEIMNNSELAPIVMFNSGDVLSGANTSDGFSGFLVDSNSNIEVVNPVVSSANTYTVPTGKTLVITKAVRNAYLRINSINISYNSSSVRKISPLIASSGDVISTSTTTNNFISGYLVPNSFNI